MKKSNHNIYKLLQKISLCVDIQDDKNSMFEKQELWKTIQRKVEMQKAKRLRIQLFSMAALVASIIVFITLFSPIKDHSSEPDLSQMAADFDISIDSIHDVQLIISNDAILVDEGSLISYSKTGSVGVDKKNIKSESLAVDKDCYNKVIVPRGKRVRLLLSDGSKLDVNSGTKVIYPRIFKGDRREIFVDGEIFIDVAPNKDAPFIVKTSTFAVRALGTAFNVRAYSYEPNAGAEVVLVQGKVRVRSESGDKIEMEPNQMLSLSEGVIGECKSVDVSKYISWRDGVLELGVLSLQEICDRLMQYYRVKIVCDPTIKDVVIYGKLDMEHSIDEILKSLSVTVPFVYEYCTVAE